MAKVETMIMLYLTISTLSMGALGTLNAIRTEELCPIQADQQVALIQDPVGIQIAACLHRLQEHLELRVEMLWPNGIKHIPDVRITRCLLHLEERLGIIAPPALLLSLLARQKRGALQKEH